jgi:hypothetical protein
VKKLLLFTLHKVNDHILSNFGVILHYKYDHSEKNEGGNELKKCTQITGLNLYQLVQKFWKNISIPVISKTL